MQLKNRRVFKQNYRRLFLLQLSLLVGASSMVVAADGLDRQPCAPVVTVNEYCPPLVPSPTTPRSRDSQSTGDSMLDYTTDVDQDLNLSDDELDAVVDSVASTNRTSSLASTTGGRGGLDAPNMLGDFFGGTFIRNKSESFDGSPIGSTVALAGGDRRFKISENTSPIPTDRIFANYNHFHHALTDINDEEQDLDRFTLGFEKTFWSKQASFEMRLPIGNGLNSLQEFNVPGPNTTNTELGNLAMSLKFVLLSDDDSVLSAGLTSTVPTGDNYIARRSGVDTIIKNDAVHVAPFLGYLARPNEDWFFQSYAQVDVDLNGNDVYDSNRFRGVIQDQTLLFIDTSLGRWLHRRQDSHGNVVGTAFIGELHYTSTLNDTDAVDSFANPYNRMDILNATAGLHFQVGLSSLRVAMGAPLRNDEESLFDTEVLVQFNRRF